MNKTAIIIFASLVALILIGILATHFDNVAKNESSHKTNQTDDSVIVLTPINQEEPPLEQDAAVTNHTEEVTPSSTQIYQDDIWKIHVTKYSTVIETDFNLLSDSANNRNFVTMDMNGKELVKDTQAAINENRNIKVSPAFKDAQTTWMLALADYNSAGHETIRIASDGKNYYVDEAKVKNVTALISEGNQHLNETAEYINKTQ